VKEHLHVFTSRYSNPNVATSRLAAIGITRYPPRFRLAYQLKANLYDLAPSAALFAKSKEGLSRDGFLLEYERQLAQVGLEDILRRLAGVQGNAPGVVLLCYEDLSSGQVCHRTLLADWLKRIGSIAVSELPDPGRKAARKTATSARKDGLW
jgi:hypothetical protein